MEDFVRKTRGVRDITSLPLDTSHELDIVSDVKGKIYIKILNRYKELLFDNGTDQWVIDMLNNLEVDVKQLKEDILDVEQALTEIPIIEDKLATVETKLAQINTLFAQMQIDVKGIDLRTAELEREVVQLALKDQELLDKINDLDVDVDILYSNLNDFGDYDYSGNPNLMPNLDFSKLSGTNYAYQKLPSYVKDGGTFFVIDRTDPSFVSPSTSNVFIPLLGRLEKGATYAVTIPMMVSEDFGTDYVGSPIYPYNVNDGVITTRPWMMVPNADCRGKWQFIKKTFTVPSDISDGKFAPFLQVYQNDKQTGKFYIGYDIKIEKVTSTSDTATPYQPNLLDAPYYLSKVPLGENILKPTSFPINTTEYMAVSFIPNEPYVQGQKYTFTMKATKQATQTFEIYLRAGSLPVGKMIPVEGLTDVWQLTFEITQSHIDGLANALNVFQMPQATKGMVNIEWAKLEKGDTRTPNIPYYKYVGINTEASKNPNDYEWIPLAKSSETVDARLTKTISTYDTVNALQNNRLTALESKVVDTTWQNVTVTEPFTSVTQPQVKKQNGIVYMRGTISNGTGDCFTLPEGFRPPEGAYEMQFRLPCRSASAADYATIYVRPSGLCSIAGVNGTMPIFLSGIIFSTT